jgi:16S rRNA (cytidine1402-2'-O)-methyltransferase
VPEKNAIQPSTLYLVATPIGNLDDMTFRALKVLKEATLIAAEDTRNTSKLLMHFGIKAVKLISCYEHNEIKRTEDILETLAQGGSVALVTDAGMPGISDPGYQVVKLIVEKGFKVVPIPGASALVAALPASGLVPTPFLFVGFLPPKSGDRRQALLKLKTQEQTLVFYEAPHRLLDFLKDALEVFGLRQAVAARELTKLHEEFVRGTLEELLNHFKTHEPLGELVVMIEAAAPGSNDKPPEWEGLAVADHLLQLMKEEGFTKTEAVKAVAKARRLSRDEVYQIAVTVNYSGTD